MTAFAHPSLIPAFAGRRVAILSSGGMDSFLVWAHYHQLGIATINVFVNLGHKYQQKERSHFSRLTRIPGFAGVEVQGQDIGYLETPSGIIPNRNAHLILAAASISRLIALGILHGEINSDKSGEFLKLMRWMLDVSNRGQYWNNQEAKQHEIYAPLNTLTKSEAVQAFLQAPGNDPHFLFETVSCYAAEAGHCGACPSCFKRWVALRNNHLCSADGAPQFNSDPRVWAEKEGIFKKCEDGTYGARRANEIKSAMEV